jgi:hypothetical protein
VYLFFLGIFVCLFHVHLLGEDLSEECTRLLVLRVGAHLLFFLSLSSLMWIFFFYFRVFNIIKYWIEHNLFDFKVDPKLLVCVAYLHAGVYFRGRFSLSLSLC